MSRGLRNNNPGNIRKSSSRWQGKVTPSQDPQFEQFVSMAYGYRAMFKLLGNYQKKQGLHTLREIIGRWAPPGENHTDIYIQAVAKGAEMSPDQRIETGSKNEMVPIVAAMSQVENGVPAVMDDVEAGWELFIRS